MRVLVQRSKNSKVTIDEKVTGEISEGIVAFVGFTHTDTLKQIQKLAKKLANLRIFDDENHIMNKSLLDVGGSVLSISQFTLYGDAAKGNRPSYIAAMPGEKATELYDAWNQELLNLGIDVQTGIFGADMFVEIQNDGPITILLESEAKHD